MQPAELVAVRGAPGRLVCQIQQADVQIELVARLVIVACGSWNNAGPFAIPAGGKRKDDLLAFKGHFVQASLPDGLMPLLAFPGGYGGLVNSDAGRLSFSCCIQGRLLREIRHPGERAADAALGHVQDTTRGLKDVLCGSVLAHATLSVGPLRPGAHQCYRDGLFFVGNIAGEAHPIIADGISMAIQSAWLLTHVLMEAGPDANFGELGEKYARAWHAAFRLRIAASAFFAHLAMTGMGRTMAGSLVKAFPGLLRLGARVSGKTDTQTGLSPQITVKSPNHSAL
jgi:flavin-dependent dehydrogenase